MQFLRVCNWEKYQHYKDRDPKWVKLYRDLLTSEMWATCNDASRTLAIACMLLAAKCGNKIPANAAYVRRVAYLNQDPDFEPLKASGFIELFDESQDASKPLAMRYQRARPEKRRVREEKEKKKEVFVLPDWIPAENWKSWLEVRKGLKAPNTPRALKIAVTELERLKSLGHDPAKVLDQSTLKGWKSVYPIKPELAVLATEPAAQLCDYCSKTASGKVNGRRACDDHWQMAMANERPLKVAI